MSAPEPEPRPRLGPEGSTGRLIGTLIRFFTGRRRTIVSDVSESRAMQAASDRRRLCESVMRGRPSLRRPLEHPPEIPLWRAFPEPSGREIEDAYDWLRVEMQSPPLLLAGRVSDTVTTIISDISVRNQEPFEESWARISPVVALQRIPQKILRAQPNLFPWRALISSRTPKVFTETFKRSLIGSWIGVGVDVEYSEPPILHASCRWPGGMSGEIGGTLHFEGGNGADWAVTCAHVVAHPTCCSARLVEDYQNEVTAPDLALLETTECCLPLPEDLGAVDSFSFDSPELPVGEVVYLNRARGKKVTGIIESHISGFTHGPQQRPCYVPSFSIRRIKKMGIIPWPPFGKFSEEGDSGTWVLGEDGSTWYGMVVSGIGSLSYAHAPEPLLRSARKLSWGNVTAKVSAS